MADHFARAGKNVEDSLQESLFPKYGHVLELSPIDPPTPCTLTMTVSLSGLGIKPGSGLYSITGGSFYFFATPEPAPATRVSLGFSNQADVTAALDDNGTGTTK
jgi:hypothetical protein